MPPLMLFDLDNTLIDRDRAFRAWAASFLADRDLPPSCLDWLVTLDGGGYVGRRVLMRAAVEHFGLSEEVEPLLEEYREHLVQAVECPSAHLDALQSAREAGWTIGIVSNGDTKPQLAKMERTGLADLVDGWIISEEADCAKPDPRIFRLAAERCGVRPDSGWPGNSWMVGDHPPADIAGARLTGLRSVWLAHGRPWPETAYAPTFTADALPTAVTHILGSTGALD